MRLPSAEILQTEISSYGTKSCLLSPSLHLMYKMPMLEIRALSPTSLNLYQYHMQVFHKSCELKLLNSFCVLANGSFLMVAHRTLETLQWLPLSSR